MVDRKDDFDVETTCGRLRDLLEATRGLDRREFSHALSGVQS